MDLIQLNTELSELGTVGLLEESNNILNISIQGVVNKLQAYNDFNTIVINSILPVYHNIDAIVIEGESLKAIFSK